MIDFKTYIFLLHLQLFSKLRFTPKVGQIVYLNWSSAHTRVLLWTVFMPRCCLRCVWVVHGSTIHLLKGIANPSRFQAGYPGARGRPNLWFHYTQAIDYFPPSLAVHCPAAIMDTHHLIQSPNEDCTVILTAHLENNHSPLL